MEKAYVQNVGIVHLLLIEDDYSRYGIVGEFFKQKNEDNALKVLREAFEEYGLPDEMIYDRDPMFVPARGGKNAKTKFGEILEFLVIDPRPASSGHAETKGKIEKLIQFVEEDFLPEGEFRNIKDLNSKFRVWLNRSYNTKHHHSALDGNTPASKYVKFQLEGHWPTLMMFSVGTIAGKLERMVLSHSKEKYTLFCQNTSGRQ